MPIAVNEFWKAAIASGALSLERCQQLHAELARDSPKADAKRLAEWLTTSGVLTRYQAAALLGGKPVRLAFEECLIHDCVTSGRLAHTLRARLTGDGREALVVFTARLADQVNTLDIADVVAAGHAALAIDSPHVSRVLRVVATQPARVVVEDLAGQSLRDWLAAKKPNIRTACRIGFEAALGLLAMHENKLAHGSVSPENLWIDATGTIKVLQFPFTADAVGRRRREPPGVDYLAPELADPRQAATGLSDIYALGCVLYELLAGRVPFPGGTPQDKMRRHRTEVAQRLDQVVPGLPEEIVDLVVEMIDKEPVLRCQTASQVAHLLAPFAAGSTPYRGRPPQGEARALTPGYGAWKAPAWQSPPREAAPVTQVHQDSVPSAPATVPTVVPRQVAGPVGTGQSISPPIGEAEPRHNAAVRESPFVVADERPVAHGRRPKRPNSTALVFGAAALGLTLLALVGYLLVGRQPDLVKPIDAPPATAGRSIANDAPTAAGAEGPAADASSDAALPSAASIDIDDDGRTLWASPTAGEPLVLEHLPSGGQAFIVLRPAEILRTQEGARLEGALGPWGEHMRARLRPILGVELEGIEQLKIAFFPDESGASQAAFAMRLTGAVEQEKLLAAWGQPAPAEYQGKKYFRGTRWAYWLPAEEHGRVVAVAPAAAIEGVLELGGRPLVAKGTERLLAGSDASRHFNLLAAPRYLLAEGNGMLEGDLDRLRGPLARFLDDGVEAALASVHLGDQLFIELRAVGTLDQRPDELAGLMRNRLAGVPARVEAYVAALEPREHGKLIVKGFPRMVKLLDTFTRAGAEDRQAVLRVYLPLAAAHNLLLGAGLTLSEDPTAASASAPRRPAAEPVDQVSESLKQST